MEVRAFDEIEIAKFEHWNLSYEIWESILINKCMIQISTPLAPFHK